MLFGLCSAVVVLALLVGGGTHSGFLGDVVVQFLSIPLLLASLWPALGPDSLYKTSARVTLVLCLTCVLVVLLQVLPLPFDVWSGRHVFFPDGDSSHFGEAPQRWSTLSITPQATWAAAVSLLVPLSVFGSVVQLDLKQRMLLCRVVLGVGAVSLALGFLQVAQGPGSHLRFYSFTNPTEAVGFFANRNHFAAFLNVTLVLAALWFAQRLETSSERRALNTSSVLWLAVSGAFFVAIVAGLALARSRAGAFLAIPLLIAIVFMLLAHSRSYRTSERAPGKTVTGRVSLAMVLFAIAFTLQFGLGRLLTRFEGDFADDLRVTLNWTTFETALKALPFGTGLGSFVSVYATIEKPQDMVAAFVNRAHDDFAELFLETGFIGLSLGILFLLWLGRRSYAIWRRRNSEEHPQQSLLMRASTLIVAMLLIHSLVDYPLRTAALGAVFAVFCGFVAAPVKLSYPDESTPRRRTTTEPRRRSIVKEPSVAIPDTAGSGTDIQWPITWQTDQEKV